MTSQPWPLLQNCSQSRSQLISTHTTSTYLRAQAHISSDCQHCTPIAKKVTDEALLRVQQQTSFGCSHKLSVHNSPCL